jgi:peptidoglycan/LPS O-acetylase OafA/YrhL
MTQALSLYLDVLRFAAAFTVFLSHYAAGRHSGGLFRQVGPYGRVAVLVFFVLSGFVIAFVSETRERTLEECCLSRFARLYSVILPAFIATAALDGLAAVLNPGSNLGSGRIGSTLSRITCSPHFFSVQTGPCRYSRVPTFLFGH